jgi:hypothetical protein
METSSLNNVLSSVVQNTRASARAENGRAERERDENTSERVGGPRRGGQLAKALEQTLSQFGFNPPDSKGAPPATASQANDAANRKSADTTATQSPEQAVQGFMYALFQSLGAQGNRPSGPAPKQDNQGDQNAERTESVSGGRGRRGYGDIEARLQNLVQSLTDKTASGSSSDTTTSTSSSLETAFQNLSKALEGNGNTGTSKLPDIQTFLKTLQQNIQNAGSRIDSSGNLVNTIA